MSQPAAQTSLMTTLQLQMVNAITQQSALFTQMNTLLKTLNDGFNNLTLAIRKNTEAILKMSIGPKSGLASMLSKTMGAGPAAQLALGKAGIATQTQYKFNQIDLLLDQMFQFLAPISPVAAPTLLTKDQTTPKETYQDLFQKIIPSMGEGFKTMLSGVKDVLVGGALAPLGGLAPGEGLTTASLQQMGGGFAKIWKGTFAAMGKQGKAAIAPLGAAFGSMFPQMAALAIVMEPIMAFIGGLLEPFSMITDMFGAFGEILGTALIPVLTTAVMPLLYSMMPLFTSIAQILGPLLQLFFAFSGLGILIQIITPLMPLINTLAGALATVMNVVSPVITLFTQLFSAFISFGITTIIQGLVEWIGSLGVNLDSLKNGFQKFVEVVGTVAELLQGLIDLLAGRISAVKKLGFSETSWF